jgi:hypothetical protein
MESAEVIQMGSKHHSILYPEFLALLAKYLCQRLTILQEFCKIAKLVSDFSCKNIFKYINN